MLYVGHPFDIGIRISHDSDPDDCEINRVVVDRREEFPWGIEIGVANRDDGPGETTVLRGKPVIFMFDAPGTIFRPTSTLQLLDVYNMDANYKITVTDKSGAVAGEATLEYLVKIRYTHGRTNPGNSVTATKDVVHECC